MGQSHVPLSSLVSSTASPFAGKPVYPTSPDVPGLEAGEFWRKWRPLKGKCIIQLDEPVAIGSIVIPEAYRGARLDMSKDIRKHTDSVYPGTCVKVTPRDGWDAEGFKDGDRVLVALLGQDLGKNVIMTDNRRVYAATEK